jgi:hypothetical protein
MTVRLPRFQTPNGGHISAIACSGLAASTIPPAGGAVLALQASAAARTRRVQPREVEQLAANNSRAGNWLRRADRSIG